MTKKIFIIFLFLIGLSGAILLTNQHTARSAGIDIISNKVGGSGTWESPYIINTNIIKWKVIIANDGAYTTSIKPSGYRSCATLLECGEIYQVQTDNQIFEWRGMAGKYKIKLDTPNGDELLVFVHCRVPPLQEYSLPYTPPNTNSPVIRIDVDNKISGSGTSVDPYVVNGPIIKFNFDGSSGMTGGVINWAINTDGNHPIYSGGQAITNALDTFTIWDTEVSGKIFQWDTRERVSNTGEYNIEAYAIDKYGNYFQQRLINFIISGSTPSVAKCTCNPWRVQGCGQGNCSSGEMQRTRVCGPNNCDIQESCTNISNALCNDKGAGNGVCGNSGSGGLTITKSSNVQRITSDGEILYTIFYHNRSQLNIVNADITDYVPSGTTYIAGSATPSQGFLYSERQRMLLWQLSNISAGQSGSVVFKVKVN